MAVQPRNRRKDATADGARLESLRNGARWWVAELEKENTVASDLNEVRIEGGITQEPQQGYMEQSGMPYWRSTVASDGTRYDSEKRQTVPFTTFVYCTAVGYAAEKMMEANLSKGDKIRVEGSIANRVKEENGVKETKTHVEVKLFHVLRQRGASRPAPAAASSGWGNEPAAQSGGGWGNGPDTEPPF